MDDMNAFDRQLAGVVLQRVGPSRPVNDAAIFTAITTTQSAKWRFQSMFSATKFVVAGAIVALFGGFLLMSIQAQPSEDLRPAAATASSSPTTTADLPSGPTTEVVEPGVLRVLEDGAGHDFASMQLRGVWSGEDGSLWVLKEPDDQASEPFELLRLGVPGGVAVDLNGSNWFDLAVAADGTLWAKSGAGLGQGELQSFDGTDWMKQPSPDGSASVAAIEATEDGSVWVTRGVRDHAGPWAARIEGGDWTVAPAMDDPALQGAYHGEGPFVEVGPDGTLWQANGFLHTSEGETPSPRLGLFRFDGDSWQRVEPVPDTPQMQAGPLAVGPDGTLWTYLFRRDEAGESLLARWADDAWSVFGGPDGVPGLDMGQGYEPRMAVGSDATLWMAFDFWGERNAELALIQAPTRGARKSCRGLLAFDGIAWQQYLEGYCVNHVDVARDGSVWATAAVRDDTNRDLDRAGLYVIAPEAVQ